jgi:hypothetical protein
VAEPCRVRGILTIASADDSLATDLESLRPMQAVTQRDALRTTRRVDGPCGGDVASVQGRSCASDHTAPCGSYRTEEGVGRGQKA